MTILSARLLVLPAMSVWLPLSRTHRFDMFLQEVPLDIQIRIAHAFATHVLLIMKRDVKEAIRRQVFPGAPYRPLSLKWAERKRRMGLQAGYWRAGGFLTRSLSVWRETRGGLVHCIGFPPNLIHPGYNGSGSTTCAAIARSLELGSPARHIPARPLFAPIAANLSRRISDIFVDYVHRRFPQYDYLINADRASVAAYEAVRASLEAHEAVRRELERSGF